MLFWTVAKNQCPANDSFCAIFLKHKTFFCRITIRGINTLNFWAFTLHMYFTNVFFVECQLVHIQRDTVNFWAFTLHIYLHSLYFCECSMIFSKTSLYIYSNGRKRQRDRFKTVCHIGLRLYVCNMSCKGSAGNLRGNYTPNNMLLLMVY